MTFWTPNGQNQSIQKTAPVDETAEVFCGSKFTATGEVFRIFAQKT